MKIYVKSAIIIVLFALTISPSCYRQYDEDLKIYFIRTGNVYQIKESGEDLKLLLSGGTYNYPCPSPDGKYLLCRFGTISAIYDMETLSTFRTFVTASPYTHSWSPDGKKIAATDGPGTTKVFDVDSGVQIWTSGGGGKTGRYFTVDSLYITETNGVTLNEYLPELDVIPERAITLPGTYNNLSISCDGKYLVGDNGVSIIVINTTTLTAQTIATGTQPSWSPDSDEIVYVNGGNIYFCDTNGNVLKQLTFSGVDSYPCFQYKPR